MMRNDTTATTDTLSPSVSTSSSVPCPTLTRDTVFSYYLSQEISQLPLARDVVVNVVNPGLCVSQLRRELSPITGRILDALSLSGEEGAKNLAWAATEDTSAEPGCFVSSTRIGVTSPFTHSEEGKQTQKRFWKECQDVWRAVAPAQVETALSA